jgi:hypothetical protein
MITTMEFSIRKLRFSISVLKKLITCLKEQMIHVEVAKKAAKELRQQLDTVKRYLFVKICHMFSYATHSEDVGVDV